VWVDVRYWPKSLSAAESRALLASSVRSQVEQFATRVDRHVAEGWAVDFQEAELIVPNLLTISVDDPSGAYRGAGHRHDQSQHLTLGAESASPGLVAGDLPPGTWTLTLTAHTLVSAQCEVDIQIGAEIDSSRP